MGQNVYIRGPGDGKIIDPTVPWAATSSTGGAQVALSAGVAKPVFVASTTRMGGCIYSATQIVNINIGTIASATAFSDQVTPGGSWYYPSEVRGLPVSAFCASDCNIQVTSWK